MCRMMVLRSLLGLLALLAMRPAHAVAWGEKGHETVARIAELNLTAKAKTGIRDLLDEQAISSQTIAMFADRFKHTPAGKHTAAWHFVNIPFEADEFEPTHCPDGNCVVDKIGRFAADLADKSASLSKRRLALKFFVHFVGDIHQPLHCCDRDGDRGGNAIPVTFLGQSAPDLNLHSVWDGNLVSESSGDLDVLDYARRLNDGITSEQKSSWQAATPADWATESHKLAKKFAYGPEGKIKAANPPMDLDQDYVNVAKPVVEDQLKKGGIRLAKLLNDAFE